MRPPSLLLLASIVTQHARWTTIYLSSVPIIERLTARVQWVTAHTRDCFRGILKPWKIVPAITDARCRKGVHWKTLRAPSRY
jgi:hypothetical protein